MKNRIKALSLALALTLSVGLLAGCSSNKAASSAAGTDASSAAQGTGGSTARSVDEIKKSGKVIIGVFSDKNPFGYVDANGKYQGYDVYFAERIAKDLGVEPEYVSLEPASRVEYLKTGKVDIVLANFTVTKERAEAVDFALPYMKVALGVVSPEKNLITDVKQLAEINLVKFDQYTETYNALLDGRGDAFSTDNTEVLAWALQNPGFKVGIESLGDVDTIAPAVQKGNKELLDWLNEEIKTLGKENFFHKDFEETLKPVYGNAVAPENLVVEGGDVK